jgi:cytoskeletal protein CcmA (bactofilin family)
VEGTIDAQRLAMREGALLNGSVNAGDGRPAPRASMTGLATG